MGGGQKVELSKYPVGRFQLPNFPTILYRAQTLSADIRKNQCIITRTMPAGHGGTEGLRYALEQD